MFRDVAAAHAVEQSFARSTSHGVPLIDPYYRGEAFWYNPVVPAMVAGLSKLSGVAINVVDARAGAYLNLATPIAFYAMIWAMFGPLAAVAATGVFLFVEPFSSWQAATYSPWLIVSNFAQAFFYLGIIVWMRFQAAPRLAFALAMGAAIGAALLVHTAPAALLGVLFTWGLLSAVARTPRRAPLLLGSFGAAAATAVIVAIPTLATVVHYRGRIVQPLPFLWLDPAMTPENFPDFLKDNATKYFLNALALLGLVALVRHRASQAKAALIAWTLGSLALFAWSGYAWRLVDWEILTRLAIVPAHHFLVYFRAAQVVFCGLGIVAIGEAIAARIPRFDRTIAVCAVTCVAVLAGLPAYFAREDVASYPVMARHTFPDADQRAAVDWIARQTRTTDVFLAPENASMSMIAVVGRKVVLVDRFFSNPYVDWYARDRDTRDMWSAIASGDCRRFDAVADRYRVTYILGVDGMTPQLVSGVCKLDRAFKAGAFSIYSRRASSPGQ